MIAFVLAGAMAAGLQQPTPAAAQNPAPELAEIRAACAKLAESESYTFHHSSLDEGMGGFGGGRGGPPGGDGAAAQPPAPTPVEFTANVKKGSPVHFVQGPLEAWRQDNVLVWRENGGDWQRFDAQAGRGGFGGNGGERPSEEQMRSMRARMGLMSAQTAQELVTGFETKIAEVKAANEGGKKVYTGTLTPEAAAAMGGGGRFGRGGGRGGQPGGGDQGAGGQGRGGQGGGGDAPAFQNSGNFRIVVDEKGRVESFTLDTMMSGTIQERSFERKRHVEYRFSQIGATKVEVPEAVTAKFAEKPPAEGSLEF